MSASLIADYEDEFATTADQTKRDMAGLRAGLPSPGAADGGAEVGASASPPTGAITANRGEVSRNISASIRRMRDVLANLEIEAAQAPVALRGEVKGRIAGYKATLAALEKDSTTLKKQCVDADREDLLRSATTTAQRNLDAIGGGGEDGESTKMKAQLARNTQRMKDSSKTLRDAERLTHDMNETADATLIELEKQRHTVRNIGDTVRQTDAELSHVQRVLRVMHREMLKNKLMLAGIIALLLIMIIGVLYYKFGGTSKTHGDEASQVSGTGGSHDIPPPVPGPTDTSGSGGGATPSPDDWIKPLPPPPPMVVKV